MKNSILITIVLTLSIATFAAEEKSDFSYSLSSTWFNKYVAPSGYNAHDEPVIQNSITVNYTSGTYLNIFHSGSANSRMFDRKNDEASEIDYTIGWFGRIWDSFYLNLGISYWDTGDLFDDEGDTLLTYIKLSKSFNITKTQSLTPFTQLSIYTPLEGWNGDGLCFYTGIQHDITLNDKLSISSTATWVYDDGALGADSGNIGSLGTGFSYKVNESLTLTPGIKIYTPLEHLNDSRETEIVCSINAIWKF